MINNFMGISVAQDFLGLSYDLLTIQSDVALLYNMGFEKIRVALPFYIDTLNIEYCRIYLQEAKKKHLYTIWGVSSQLITSINWSAIKTGILNIAKLAQIWGTVDEFVIGNEFELNHDGSISSATIRNDLRLLASQVKSIFNGNIPYGPPEYTIEGADNILAWINEGKGGLDLIGFHCYNTFALFQTKINEILSAYGNNAYIAEFGPQTDFVSGGYTEQSWYDDWKQRIDFLRTTKIQLAIAYTFKSNDNWNLSLGNGNYRQAWDLFQCQGSVKYSHHRLIKF